MLKLLLKLKINIHWIHLGGGPILKEINDIVKTFPKNIKCDLKGMIDSEDILKFYVDKEVDLFINTSSSEGVPVTIMEACSKFNSCTKFFLYCSK